MASLEAAAEYELFAFFGWQIAWGFDRNIDAIRSECGTLKCEAVAQGDFSNRNGIICAFCVEIAWGC